MFIRKATETDEDFAKENEVLLIDPIDNQYKVSKLTYQIAGDTDSAMFRVPQRIIHALEDNKDDIVSFADMIGEETMAQFPGFIKAAFNCPDSRLDKIATDREAVSDKSLFVTKKRYIMHIIDNEGIPVDKWKIQGLEVKKSDTPTAVKKFLETLLHDLVDGLDYEDVIGKIDAFKKEYYTMNIKEIGRPMPAKKLKKYEKIIEANGGSLKGVPYQVKAAISYNSMCNSSDRPIVPGDKFHLVYIKHPNHQSIGLPVDLQHIPEWVKEIPIDYEKMWKTANKKIINYLTSVGWDIDSRQNTRTNDIFGIQ